MLSYDWHLPLISIQKAKEPRSTRTRDCKENKSNSKDDSQSKQADRQPRQTTTHQCHLDQFRFRGTPKIGCQLRQPAGLLHTADTCRAFLVASIKTTLDRTSCLRIRALSRLKTHRVNSSTFVWLRWNMHTSKKDAQGQKKYTQAIRC